VDAGNRPLSFSNLFPESLGGFQAVYADTGERVDTEGDVCVCFIDGVRCRAREAYFGGVVVDPEGVDPEGGAPPALTTIRPFRAADAEAVVRLALRAWAPVFPSIERALGPEVYRASYPDGWEASQRAAVEAALAGPHVWVAERDGAPAGFVVVVLHRDDRLGEIHMVAVDPDRQGAGIGTALTEHALGWMREAGMEVAMVETGADPGHAPARRTYERVGFGLFPVARYFKKL
jgi:GNAT superfamily N-acetyltransferase